LKCQRGPRQTFVNELFLFGHVDSNFPFFFQYIAKGK
jgi:hypothetical protein